MMRPLERAARALAKRNGHLQARHGGTNMTPDAWADAHWRDHIEDARAVLQAIWEPSDAQIQAARDFTPINHPADVWPAMIEAAIEEG